MSNSDDFPTPECRYHHFVSYGETDCARVLYYGEYLHIFERARSQLVRDRGMSYAEVEDRGIILPVRKANCRYLAPARYDEELVVRCAISRWGGASLTFAYQVLGPPEGKLRQGAIADARLLATGETEHALVGPDGRIVRVPKWLKELFGK